MATLSGYFWSSEKEPRQRLKSKIKNSYQNQGHFIWTGKILESITRASLLLAILRKTLHLKIRLGIYDINLYTVPLSPSIPYIRCRRYDAQILILPAMWPISFPTFYHDLYTFSHCHSKQTKVLYINVCWFGFHLIKSSLS